jgi:MoxR-like ATPase
MSQHDGSPNLADGEPIQSKHITHQPAPRIGDLNGAYSVYARLRERLGAVVRGRDEVIELIIVAVLADGHVLLEDFPGSGKTTLAKALGDSIVDDQPHDEIVALRRIQFTPDLLPSDVTGATIFDPNTNRFFFRPGPIFAHIVLADEINRTTPKVQSALLEAMAEKQVTVDNRTRRLDDLFLVIATQNPLDVAGTFPLPNAQLDRFLFKIRMTHIAPEAELEVLRNHHLLKASADRDDLPRVTRTEILDARRVIQNQIHLHPAIHQALVEIAHATRTHERILQGVSTRSLVLGLSALQAHALTRQRHYVTAEDIEATANEIFSHRIEVAPGAGEANALIRECCTGALERLAAATMGRA